MSDTNDASQHTNDTNFCYSWYSYEFVDWYRYINVVI